MALSRRFRFILSIAILVMAVIAGTVLMARASGAGYLVAGAVALAGIVLSALQMKLERDMPGGFNNPDGLITRKYARFVGYAAHAFLLVACLAIAALLLYMGGQETWPSLRGIVYASLGIGAVFVYVAIKVSPRVGFAGLVVFVVVPIALLWLRHDG